MRKYLVTSALPYANGPLHFGHLAGAYLPSDVYVRHLRLSGKKVLHICGSDEHGVAIMLNAQKAKIPYKEYVDQWNREHEELFKAYGVSFDFFGRTSDQYHHEETVEWFKILNEKGYIGTKDEQQLYCNSCHNHLPDRFVEGTCYQCGYEQARGDECPNCGTWIEPSKLKNPVCKICTSHDIKEVTVTQFYLLLSKFHKEFREWLETKKDWRKTVYPYLDSLSKEGMHDRAITRDLDWGIDVPLPNTKGKKLYVWFDAPIGYVSNLKEHLKRTGSKEHYLSDWWKNPETEIVNFIGKDNIIFHGIIFPMMSMASGRVNPVTNLPANQYLNLEGKQFSKSTGWYVDAKAALEQFGPDALRFYLISIIPETTDSSFAWDHFQAKINNELANNIGNFVNRSMSFMFKNWPDGINPDYFNEAISGQIGVSIKACMIEHLELLDKVNIKKALERVMALGHEANNYFTEAAPWAKYKVDQNEAAKVIAASAVYTIALGHLFAPYLPHMSEKIFSLFGMSASEAIYKGDLLAIKSYKLVKKPEALIPKIEDDVIKKLQEELKSKM